MVTLSNGNTTVTASEETAPSWLALGYEPIKKAPKQAPKQATRQSTRSRAKKVEAEAGEESE